MDLKKTIKYFGNSVVVFIPLNLNRNVQQFYFYSVIFARINLKDHLWIQGNPHNITINEISVFPRACALKVPI